MVKRSATWQNFKRTLKIPFKIDSLFNKIFDKVSIKIEKMKKLKMTK